MRSDGLNLALAFEPLRPTDEERYACAAFVNARLPAAQAAVEALAVRPVVGQENEDGVVADSQFLDLPQQPPEVVVEIAHHRVDRLRGSIQTEPLIHFEILIGHLKGRVRRVEGNVQEERAAPVLLHKPDRFVGEKIRNVTA